MNVVGHVLQFSYLILGKSPWVGLVCISSSAPSSVFFGLERNGLHLIIKLTASTSACVCMCVCAPLQVTGNLSMLLLRRVDDSLIFNYSKESRGSRVQEWMGLASGKEWDHIINPTLGRIEGPKSRNFEEGCDFGRAQLLFVASHGENICISSQSSGLCSRVVLPTKRRCCGRSRIIGTGLCYSFIPRRKK